MERVRMTASGYDRKDPVYKAARELGFRGYSEHPDWLHLSYIAQGHAPSVKEFFYAMNRKLHEFKVKGKFMRPLYSESFIGSSAEVGDYTYIAEIKAAGISIKRSVRPGKKKTRD